MAKRKKQDALTRAAKGAPCFFNIAGVCLDPHQCGHETTVAAHVSFRDGSKGTGSKVNNLSTAFACSECHVAYDEWKTSKADHDYYGGRALIRTILWREETGGILVKR